MCKNSYFFLLRNFFIILSVILLASATAPPKSVKCYCDDSGFGKSAKFPCPQSTDPEERKIDCESGWCHNVQLSVTIPEKDKTTRSGGSFSSKGCATEGKKKNCDTRSIDHQGVSATLTSCFCSTDLCNDIIYAGSVSLRTNGFPVFCLLSFWSISPVL